MNEKHLTTPTYVIVWLALLALTLVSFLFSLAHLGAADTAIALGIAVAKTLLVLLFFMHLIEQRIENALWVIVAGLFIVMLATLMVVDVTSRTTFPRAPSPAAPLP